MPDLALLGPVVGPYPARYALSDSYGPFSDPKEAHRLGEPQRVRNGIPNVQS
jgi:hypothetical protein